MAYNQTQKLQDNIEAVRIALSFRPGTKLSPEEMAALQKYSGFGGIKSVLYPEGPVAGWEALNASKEDIRLYPKMMAFHQLLKETLPDNEYREAISSLKNSTLTAFYTPAVIPKTLYKVLNENGISPKSIYEPSAGAGVFLTEANKAFPELENSTAVEKDILTGKVLQALAAGFNVDTKVHVTGLESSPVEDNGQYDLLASNMPFGNINVHDPAYPEHAISGRIHNYFFAK
eukprot:gene61472-84085_t